MTLPNDYARCAGAGWDECRDCQRHTAPGGEQHMQPPAVVTFWCEYYIPTDRPEDQQLRKLAAALKPTTTDRACRFLPAEPDHYRQLLTDDRTDRHPLANVEAVSVRLWRPSPPNPTPPPRNP